jgi:hypothetical protein
MDSTESSISLRTVIHAVGSMRESYTAHSRCQQVLVPKPTPQLISYWGLCEHRTAIMTVI